LNEEAAHAFSEAGARLFDTGEFEKSLSSYQKTLELYPNNEKALKGVVSAHVALGAADEAAELLERLVADRPGDPELVLMLARAYLDAENPQGAEGATQTLFKQDPANYTRLLEVAKLYLKKGEVDDATRVLGGIVEQLLAGREENDLLALLNEGLALNPEHIEALRLLIRVYWWQRDMDNLRMALERLADAAEAAGLVEDERYALTQLIRLTPDDRYSERLIALGGSPEEPGEIGGLGGEAELPETPSFDGFAITSEESDVAPEQVTAVEFEWNSVAEPVPADPSASFADLNEDEEATEVFANSLSDAIVAPMHEAGRREGTLRQELESVDFYITQGYVDIANDTLDLMERQFGNKPEIAARRQKLELKLASQGQPAANPFESNGSEQLVDSESIAADVDFAFAGTSDNGGGNHVFAPVAAETKGIDAGLAEIFEEFRQAAEDEPEAREDFETHYNMGTAYKEMDLLDEAIMEFQTAAGLTVPTDGTSRYLQCCNMLGHCFMRKDLPRAAVLWFKKGLDAPGQGEEESKALRYELGSAFEQMGDLSRARDLFTEVYGMDVAYRGVGEKLQELEQKRASKKRKK
jgi:tetratricopeptide (TPR) repeat protein